MSEAKLAPLFRVTLDPFRHKSTGKTSHWLGSEELPAPSALCIAELESAYYLLYLDDEGSELTDTYHESLQGAFAQAEFEFGVTQGEWTAVQ